MKRTNQLDHKLVELLEQYEKVRIAMNKLEQRRRDIEQQLSQEDELEETVALTNGTLQRHTTYTYTYSNALNEEVQQLKQKHKAEKKVLDTKKKVEELDGTANKQEQYRIVYKPLKRKD